MGRDQLLLDPELNPDNLEREAKESISSLKASWSEAAKSNPGSLNIDEFLALEHPESSMSLLISDLEHLLNKYDENGDGKLTKAEFTKEPFIQQSPEEIQIREEHFVSGLDIDHNGVADRREMINFLDPKNRFWAAEEARILLKNGDANFDGLLSLQEILMNPELFLKSKFVNPHLYFHPEIILHPDL
ncbi:reticulocalbin-2 [Eurytemora carolleeae]|uniref:reticulocalbin-2 n=1 Tax=Eurytemora carolleeae TaxID=1294199 RepID=UPI000C78AF78|nr:reticulocalbin-2 [Eurytemora carolleeae]|eukprot:XP_023347946.1 reticulocalbin-2-like [Eurytemora affinis]